MKDLAPENILFIYSTFDTFHLLSGWLKDSAYSNIQVSAAVSRQGGLGWFWVFKYYARSFNQPLNKWNVSNVESMYKMFLNAESFNQPLNKWNVSNVEIMNFMFSEARSFNQPLNDWDVSNDDWDVSNVSHVTTMDDMFLGATSFNQPRHAPWYH